MNRPAANGAEQVTLMSYLLFLITIPFGEVSLGSRFAWLTVTKAGFLCLLAGLGYAAVRGWRPPIDRVLILLLAVFLAAACLATCFSHAPSTSWLYFARYVGLALLCWITACVVGTDGSRIALAWTVLLATAFVLSLIGIYQTICGKTIGTLGIYGDFGRLIDLFVSTEQGGVSVFRASASFDHPNLFGTFLIAVIPFGLLAATWRGAARFPWLFLAGTLLCLVAVIYTFSRSAWLALAVGSAVLCLARPGRWHRLGLVLVAFVVAGILLPSGARTILWKRGAAVQPYDAGRLYSFRAAGHMISRHPLLGVGPGLFHQAYREHVEDRPTYRQNPRHRMDAHNTFLDIGAESGLATLIPFLALTALSARQLGRSLKAHFAGRRPLADKDMRTLLALTAGFVAILAQSLLQSLEYEEVFWILTGAGAAISRRLQAAPAPPA